MRTSAWLGLLLVIGIVACRSAPTTTEPLSNRAPPPVAVTVDDLDAKLRERLSVGLPVELELRLAAPDIAVGSCALGFDLWEETYRLALSRTQILHAKQPTELLRACVDMEKVYRARQTAETAGLRFSPTIIAREAPRSRPLYDDARDVRVW